MIIDAIPLDPFELFSLAEFYSEVNGTSFLYSGGVKDTSLYSYLFLLPYESFSIDLNAVTHRKKDESTTHSFSENPWRVLKEAMGSSITQGRPYPEWVGYCSYEMGAFADNDKLIPYFDPPIPYAYFQRCAVTIIVDHLRKEGTVVIADKAQDLLKPDQNQLLKELANPLFWRQGSYKTLKQRSQHSAPALSLASPVETFSSYQEKMEKIMEYIKSGDVYQVNLSHQTCLSGDHDAFDLFKNLSLQNPASFSAYLKNEEWAIVSSSPERLLKHQSGWLETRPIKGTVPRGKTPEEDLFFKNELLTSAKERAELLMITDLMRNDMGRISVPGSVHTKAIWQCEDYANVFHLLSVIISKADPKLHPVDLLRFVFPGGSVTGCPKLRAMEVIAEIEQRPRGIYTGSIGYFSGNGDFDFNIAIRTLLSRGRQIDLQLGGAIIYDSEPLKEYQETMHKGETLFRVLT